MVSEVGSASAAPGLWSAVRIALIADIHGNTVALDAVLADVADQRVDRIVCLGDVAANGPDPAGAIERLVEQDCLTVMGNTDADLADVPGWWHEPASVGIPEEAWPGIEIGVWGASQISEDHRRYLSSLDASATIDLGDCGGLRCFHGSPVSSNDLITSSTTDAELDLMFHGVDETFLAGGHTHVPAVRRYGSRTIINPGSVGLPFAAYGYAGSVRVTTEASYALVAERGALFNIELRQVAIDLEELRRDVARAQMPHADWWLGLWR